MPAIKANAYGHGAELIGKELHKMGITQYCVACAEEGVRLRQAGITGEILILGYTHPQDFERLRKYRLTQTVVDYTYGRELSAYGYPLLVHIGIDTVNLQGKHFTAYVKDGDVVKAGHPLVSFELEKVKQAGYDTVIPMVFTDPDHQPDISKMKMRRVTHGEKI